MGVLARGALRLIKKSIEKNKIPPAIVNHCRELNLDM